MIEVVKGAGLQSFGDSFTVGFNASGNYGYAKRLHDEIGGQFNNYGLGSSTTTYSAKAARQAIPFSGRSKPVSFMAGLNDIRHSGLNAIPKIKNNIRSFLVDCFIKDAIAASHMTRVGNWANQSQSIGGKAWSIGGNPLHTINSPDASLSWVFEGDNVVIGAYATSGINPYTYQDILIEIDGVDYGLLKCLGETNDNISYTVKVIDGFGDGDHSIVIRPASSESYTVIDYVGTLKKGSPPVMVSLIPYLQNWAQYNSVATKAIADEANNAIMDVLAEFADYPVQMINPNLFYDPSTMCSSDGIHPTSLGHDAISQAFISNIELSQVADIPSWARQVILNVGGVDSSYPADSMVIKYTM